MAHRYSFETGQIGPHYRRIGRAIVEALSAASRRFPPDFVVILPHHVLFAADVPAAEHREEDSHNPPAPWEAPHHKLSLPRGFQTHSGETVVEEIHVQHPAVFPW